MICNKISFSVIGMNYGIGPYHGDLQDYGYFECKYGEYWLKPEVQENIMQFMKKNLYSKHYKSGFTVKLHYSEGVNNGSISLPYSQLYTNIYFYNRLPSQGNNTNG